LKNGGKLKIKKKAPLDFVDGGTFVPTTTDTIG
jgi:hypothetical protein